jgi:hypothetical protein
VDGPKWSKDFNDLPQGTIMMAVRSWVGEEVSDWCKSQQIELPALSYKVASIKPGTSANTANQNFEEVFTFKEEQIDALVSKELPIHPQTQQKPFWKKLLPVILLLLFIILVIVIFSVVLSILFPLYKSQDIAIL